MTLTNEDLLAIANLLDSTIDLKLQPVYNRLDKLDSEVSGLRTAQVATRKELKEVHQKVSDTYDLALEAWGKVPKTEYGSRHYLNNTCMQAL